VDPDEILLPLDAGRQTGDRQRGGVGTEQRVGLDDILDLLEHLVLEVLALEHRLDHEVDAFEVCGIGRRGDPGQERVGALLGGLTPLEGLGLDLLRVVLAPLGGFDADVLEHHVETGLLEGASDNFRC